jgi:hypothetical protein
MGRPARRRRATAAAPGSLLASATARLTALRAAFAAGPRWTRNAAVLSAAAVVGLGGLGLSGQLRLPGRAMETSAHAQPHADRAAPLRQPAGGATGAAGAGQSGSATSARSAAMAPTRSFRRIILPDLLIVMPKGLTKRDAARLAAIRGVRNTIAFDGARITAGGRPVNVIGVNPSTFRSWVPLQTASDEGFWTALGRGDFVASSSVAHRLRLTPGSSYELAGATTETVTYGSAAWLRLNSIDLMVNQAQSRKLGLVHQVAALISAPGVSMSRLQKAVTRVLGSGARTESLRGQQLPVAGATGKRPTTYLELFKESAAQYCPGLSWTVLAAIGQIESADGTNVGPSSAGALGPMQFMPSTWKIWGTSGFGDTGPPDIMNPYDAVPAAARLLCADGAAAGGQSLYRAIFDYNHADWYVREVLALAARYAAEYN